MRERFPAVPERVGLPVPGPAGPGGAYSLHVYAAIEAAPLGMPLGTIHDAVDARFDAIWDAANAGLNLTSEALETAANTITEAGDTAWEAAYPTLNATVTTLTRMIELQGLPLVNHDAGSGPDAPGNPEQAIPIQPGVVYEAATWIADIDVYAIDLRQGDGVEVAHDGWVNVCYAIFRPDGSEVFEACNGVENLPSSCANFMADADGTWYLRFRGGGMPSYQFAVGVNQPAPTMTWDNLLGDEGAPP